MVVFLDTQTVGGSFGTVGIVRQVGNRAKIAEADVVRPYGQLDNALYDASRVVAERGWKVE